jgi:hypothetical protein
MPRFHFKRSGLAGLDKYALSAPAANGHLTDSASSQKLLEQATVENGNSSIGMNRLFWGWELSSLFYDSMLKQRAALKTTLIASVLILGTS